DCDVNVGLWLVKMYASFGCVKDARKVFDGMRVRDVAVWNAMVSGYCKVEEFEKARELFEVMEERNVVSWTALIAGYAQGNRASEAVDVFRRMRVGGVKPDEVTMVAVLSACAQLGALELGEWVHGYINEHNLRKSVSFNNALIDMYAKSGNIKKAMEVFENMKDRCVITWTTGVIGLRDSGVCLGKWVHCESIVFGLDCDVNVGLWLVKMYASFGCVKDARKVFDGMRVRDVAVWNAMVSGYCKASEAVDVFRRMRVGGVKPDEVTMVAVLSACAQLGALELGEWVHGYINEHNLRKSVSFNNALIDMYAKSGNIKKAMEVFENMKDRCVITWTTVIAGLALHGFGKEALEIFSRMEKSHVKPNDVTLIAVMSACSHSGLVKSGRWYFNKLLPKYGIKPRIEHYGCMIDLLGRAGCLSEAQELLKQMPFEPNAAIWGSLLAASRLYGNVELGEKALEQLVKLEPNNSGNFLLLSNIYATEGHWSESGSIRKVMRDNGVKKMSGASCIELNSRVHDFVSGNGSHPLPTFITLNTIGNRVRSVYLSKMNSDEVVKMLQEFPKTMSNLNLTAADTPVKYDFLDTEWIQKQGVLLERYPDERVALVGRSVMPMLSSGFDAQGIANIFVLAYHLKAPGN
nr:hypothetical protein [Tanacetum cinerariifolium]